MRLCLIAAVFALCACGSVSKDKPDAALGDGDVDTVTGDFTFDASPTAVVVPVTGSGTVNVTVTRDQFTGDIALSARDLPADVTVSYEPATLTAGVDSSVATIKAGAGTTVGMSSITLVASGGGIERTAPVALTATTITVQGTVAKGKTGIKVVLVKNGTSMSTTSTTGGAFSFSNITPPYDLYTVSTESLTSTTVIHYYQGLTRSDPVVAVSQGLQASTVSSAAVSGTVIGRSAALNVRVLWSDSGNAAGTTGGGGYSFTAQWPTAATRMGTMYALEWTSGPDNIKYGSTTAMLQAGVAATVDVTLGTPNVGLLAGTITPPATFTNDYNSVSQQVGNQSVLWQQNFTNLVNCKIPLIAAGKSAFHAFASVGITGDQTTYATTSYVRTGLDATTDVTFTLPAPADLTAPANAATGVSASTDFTFAAPANTVNAVYISTSGSTKVAYTVYTTATTVRIPNVGADASIPGAQSWTWRVGGHGSHTSVDGVATATGLSTATEGIVTGPTHTYTLSKQRTFTTP